MAGREKTHGGRTALITGASAGIGRELAGIFAKGGFDLVVVARRAERLHELAKQLDQEHGTRVAVVSKDLTAPGAAQEIFGHVTGDGIEVDVLVNNAGIMDLGSFFDTPVSRLLELVQLNVVTLTALTRLLVEPMIARGRGRILNVASVAAFQPVPSMAAYGASKAFVLSLTEALSEELRGTGVTATALCPGLTETEMADAAREASDAARLLPGFLFMSAADVAQEGYEACMAGRVISTPGLTNQMLTTWARLQPRWLVRSITGLVGRQIL